VKFAAQYAVVRAQSEHILAANPACHDWDHTLRVLQVAERLAVAENADLAIVRFAALLHDIGRPQELQDAGITCHAVLGEDIARQILGQVGIDEPAFVDAVAHCVRAHRFRRRDQVVPQSLEARVIYDADKLDAIGVVGLARAFHFAGRIGARLHNSYDEALQAPSYSRNDTAYREFLVKLQYIHANMLTASGRCLANDRQQRMHAFVQQLCQEVEGADFAATASC